MQGTPSIHDFYKVFRAPAKMESTPLISSASPTMSKFFSKYGATSETKAAPGEGQPKSDHDAPPSDIDDGSLYQVRQAKRQIGVTSAVFL